MAMSGMIVRLNARQPEALADFFVQTLGFERDTPGADIVALTLGASRLEIVGCDGRPYPACVPGWSPLFQHFAITTTDMSAAVSRLERAQGWAPISQGGPQQLPANTGGVTAFKFRDPEGHPLELIAFPDEATGAPPRIDHSAISVADTATSVGFYAALGLVIGGRSLNRSPEQDRLDGLDGVEVGVTALEFPSGGSHVELLCYRGDYPRMIMLAAPNDVAATRLAWRAEEPLGSLAEAFADRIVTLDAATGILLIRDPDGHLIQLAAA
jgi:catechol 2,3-dioxygenase-like lactoylglutathione lyase family enzyme